MLPQCLIEAALAAAENAYAPYSHFRVGAALLGQDGAVHQGCNVENASYGLTICAERAAVFGAVARGQRAFVAVAVAADGATPPYPCGACRQVLAEFCPPNMPVYVASRENPERFETFTVAGLLPASFRFGRAAAGAAD